ncbi:YjbH domain-containing protein [Pseudooceanicola sp. MF1-13]|uniref:YjbH domain-containing protein n=1 Tax=Pseudooceanicola sp. MF1-13 TaxID=3379095 RepID=UPI0038916597
MARPTYNTYGVPGLIDMPTAESAPDAEIATSVSHFAGSTRATMTFQITPRLSGSFRYSRIDRWSAGNATFDRSFDLRYRIVDEGRYRPAVAIGLQDFIGTGLYSGEYVVATKSLTPRLKVTGGIGWGRLATHGGFSNPLGAIDPRFNTRPTGTAGLGGIAEVGEWFRGDAALFGGLSFQATDRLTLKAEYSSDAYARETTVGNLFQRKSPMNFGLDYKLAEGANLKLNYLYGDTIGLGLTFQLNPKRGAVPGGSEEAPIPVKLRDRKSAEALGWTTNEPIKTQLRDGLATILEQSGIQVEGVKYTGREVTVYIRNERYLARAEAIGRTARVLTHATPSSVNTFRIVPMVNGVPTSAVVVQRDDLEVFENDPNGADQMLARAAIMDHTTTPAKDDRLADQFPRYDFSLGPYVKASYFDPAQPVRADLGIRAKGEFVIRPGLILSGQLDQRLVGNRGPSSIIKPSSLPAVRRNAGQYSVNGTSLTKLTLASYFRPGKNLYGRVTAGYLETMYAGVSGEVLWKPVNSRLALGLEVNAVQQRAYQGLGLRNYQVITGHASAYYDFGNGFHGQVDAGRYLAGDWGATFAMDREFANGWRVGAYATFTNVSAQQFGEGSFDKGIRVSVPLSYFTGKPSTKVYTGTIQSLSRDGGARLKVDNRLYENVRSYHQPELRESWGRFWR